MMQVIVLEPNSLILDPTGGNQLPLVLIQSAYQSTSYDARRMTVLSYHFQNKAWCFEPIRYLLGLPR